MTWIDQLPDRQDRARAEVDLAPPPALVSAPGQLLPEGAPIVCLGGRLANALGAVLETRGHRRIRTDAPHPALPSIEPEAEEYLGTGTGPCGNTAALDQLIRRCQGQFTPAEDRRHEGGLVVDPFRPGLRYPARSDREFDVLTERYFTGLRSALRRAQAILVALDTAEICELVADGAALPTLPHILDGERHRIRILTPAEMVDQLASLLKGLRSLNPAARVLLAISPEGAVATATPRHILAADLLSKASLRLAVEQVAARAAYIPALELAWAMGVAPDAALTDARYLSALAEAVIAAQDDGSEPIDDTDEAEPGSPASEARSRRGRRRQGGEAGAGDAPAKVRRKHAQAAKEDGAAAPLRAAPVDESGFKDLKRKRARGGDGGERKANRKTEG